MDHTSDSPAPRPASGPAPDQQPQEKAETPAQRAAATRRIRAAARAVERAQAEREALASLAPDPAPANLPAPAPKAAQPPALDAHGFDPAEYQWIPVRRRPRKDGWTPQRQQDFIACLAETGCVQRAASHAGMTVQSCYRLRRAPGGENFAAAWDVALHHAARLLLDVAFERAFNGTEEPVFDHHGQHIGRRMRHSERLMMFLLRAYMPERFRHAHRDGRAPDEALPPAPPPVQAMIERLAPEEPAAPQALMAPEELEDALFVADTLPPGELPRWHGGPASAPPAPCSPEKEAELDRLLHGTGNDPKYDRIDGPRVR